MAMVTVRAFRLTWWPTNLGVRTLMARKCTTITVMAMAINGVAVAYCPRAIISGGAIAKATPKYGIMLRNAESGPTSSAKWSFINEKMGVINAAAISATRKFP